MIKYILILCFFLSSCTIQKNNPSEITVLQLSKTEESQLNEIYRQTDLEGYSSNKIETENYTNMFTTITGEYADLKYTFTSHYTNDYSLEVYFEPLIFYYIDGNNLKVGTMLSGIIYNDSPDAARIYSTVSIRDTVYSIYFDPTRAKLFFSDTNNEVDFNDSDKKALLDSYLIQWDDLAEFERKIGFVNHQISAIIKNEFVFKENLPGYRYQFVTGYNTFELDYQIASPQIVINDNARADINGLNDLERLLSLVCFIDTDIHNLSDISFDTLVNWYTQTHKPTTMCILDDCTSSYQFYSLDDTLTTNYDLDEFNKVYTNELNQDQPIEMDENMKFKSGLIYNVKEHAFQSQLSQGNVSTNTFGYLSEVKNTKNNITTYVITPYEVRDTTLNYERIIVYRNVNHYYPIPNNVTTSQDLYAYTNKLKDKLISFEVKIQENNNGTYQLVSVKQKDN
ncbi:MAG: hypothetical protein RR568_08470 [Anaerorhabdus sp.]|uniref:hypothetical protein n=1 Tax=Anaerorhabdus sp. TaxID=1872524 RepID=UPI002FCC0424